MPPPPDNPHAARNAAITALAAQQLAALWPRVDWASPKALATVTAIYTAIALKFGRMAAAASAADYDARRATLPIRSRYRAAPTPPVPEARLAKIVASAFLGHDRDAAPDEDLVDLDAPHPARRPGLTITTSDLPIQQRVEVRLTNKLTGLVLEPGRDTLVTNTTKDPAQPTWIRVPTSPDPCEFCIMLASRELGPNFAGYHSAKNALFKENGEKYHPNCRCEAVAVFPGDDAHVLSPNMADYQQLYNDATDAAETHSDTNAILREMRKLRKDSAAQQDSDTPAVVELDTPAVQSSGGGPPKPPPRVRGMLGPEGPDEFGDFNGYTPPALRSQIDEFTIEDALAVLYGDGTPGGHGGHAHGTGGKSELPPGWTAEQVQDWVNSILDNPANAAPSLVRPGAFSLHGSYDGLAGVLQIRPIRGAARPMWHIAAVYPELGSKG